MDGISFKATFGNEVKTVELTNVSGAGSSHIHLYVDRFYWGAFHFTVRNTWTYGGDSLETAEIDILIDKVVDKWGHPV